MIEYTIRLYWRLPYIIDRFGEERERTGADNEVWNFGEEAYPILVKFIRVRELMRDYIRSLMKEAHEKGSPGGTERKKRSIW